MGLLGEMKVKFGGDTSGLNSAAQGATNIIKNISSDPLKAVGVGFLVAGTAAVAFGSKAVSMAGDFQAGITSLKTGAGEAQSNLGLVSNGILKLATDTGTS